LSTVYFNGYGGTDQTGRVSVWGIAGDGTVAVEPTLPALRPVVFDSTYYFSGLGNFQSGGIPPTASLRRLAPDGTTENLQLSFNGSPLYGGTPIIQFNEKLFFTAVHATVGVELFSVDTLGNVSLVADIFPDAEGSFPRSLVVFNDHLYFFAQKSRTLNYEPIFAFYEIAEDGSILELSNFQFGLSLGTSPYFDVDYVLFHEKMYFSALMSDESGDFGLWTVDRSGNLERAWQPTDAPGLLGGFPIVVGSDLYFYGQAAGYGIYKIGSSGEPMLVTPLTASSLPTEPFVELDGSLYFMSELRAPNGDHQRQVWRFDGQNVQSVSSVFEGDAAYQGKLTAFNGELYYFADDGVTGLSLWKVNHSGVSERVSQHSSTPTSSGVSILATPSALYFTGYDPLHGWEPWKVGADGAGSRVSDVNEMPVLWAPDNLASRYPGPTISAYLGQDLVFVASVPFDGAYGQNQLWRIGPAGITRVSDDGEGALTGIRDELHPFAGGVLTNHEPQFSSTGHDLWLINSDGSRQPITSTPGEVALSEVSGFISYGSKVIFSANTILNGTLNRSVFQIDQNGIVSIFIDISESNGNLYSPIIFDQFLLAYTLPGSLYRIDLSGNYILFSVPEGDRIGNSVSSGPDSSVSVYSGNYFFELQDRGSFIGSSELAFFDANGNWNLKNGIETPDNFPQIYPRGFIEFNGELYFRATTRETGRELWKIGPDQIPVRVTDIAPGYTSSTPFGMTEFAGALYFSADSSQFGRELWRLNQDATVELVADVLPGPTGSSPFYMHEFNGELYFRSKEAAGNRTELWKVDAAGDVHRVVWPGTTDGVFVPSQGGVDTNTPGIDQVPGSDWYIGEFNGLLYVNAGWSFSGSSIVTIDSAGSVRPATTAAPTYSSIPLNFIEWLSIQPITDFGTAESDTLAGGIANDLLSGGAGADFLVGEAGNDTLTGGTGNDQLTGGDGNDFIYFDPADTATNVTGGIGTDTLFVASTVLALPTSFNLTAQGFERAQFDQIDTSGQTWATRTIFYAPGWVPTSEVGTYDSGDTYNYTWTGGVLINFTYNDVANPADAFTSYTITYNAGGQQISVVGTYDDARTFTTANDTAANPWSSITTVFASAANGGQALYSNTSYDNGDSSVATYINGVLDSSTTYDTGANDQPYQYYTVNFNALGVAFAVSGIYDNGTPFAYLV
jgi:ELWxxDGT repeat protein